MKKLLIAFLIIGSVTLLGYNQRANISATILEAGLENNIGANIVDTFDDGLHLALCGAGGPMPAPNASGPCVAVVAGKRLFVVDSGADSPRNLGRMRYQIGDVEAVFVTHFHSDHIDALGELATLRWAAGANQLPLPVYGPEGIEKVVDGFNLTYSHDFVYRHAHHGDTVAPRQGAGLTARPFKEPAEGELLTILDEGPLKIETFAVDHTPVDPAVGYKFTYKDRSILISGDTIKSRSVENFARDVDLLVHEALAPNIVAMLNEAAERIGNPIMAKIAVDIPDYHASPVEAAELAKNANAGHLLYYHIVPPLIVPGQKSLFLNGAEKIFADYTIGVDGVAFSLPANAKDIIKTSDSLNR